MMTKNLNTKLLIFIGTFFVSFSAIILRASNAHAYSVAFYRLFLSTLVLLPVSYKNLKKISLTKQEVKSCIISGLCLCLHFAIWFQSLRYTTVASSTVFVTISPIFFGIYYFAKNPQKKSFRLLMFILISLIGSFIMGISDLKLGPDYIFGDILAIIAAILFSIYMVVGSNVRKTIDGTSYITIVYLIASLGLLVLVLLTPEAKLIYPPNEFMLFSLNALFPTLLGHGIFNYAVKFESPGYISTVLLLEPVFSIMWAVAFFNEVPTWQQAMGCSIILVGLALYTKYNKNE